MLAVIKTGGKQYIVKEGDKLTVEKLGGEKDSKVVFDEVLLTSEADGKDFKIGTGVAKAKIEATVVETIRGKKVVIFKQKPKKRYKVKKGHRQPHTQVEIGSVA